jgi:hypothetical protein
MMKKKVNNGEDKLEKQDAGRKQKWGMITSHTHMRKR